MLASLHIENVAVIKELNVDFLRGLTVLTGETGAGKSILIGSVRMLLGSKTDKEVIRKGEDYALVEGLFSPIEESVEPLLAENGIFPDENGELLILRRVSADGRNVCKINGRSVPLAALKTAGGILLGIHGQHDTQTLLDENTHLALIDRYGGNEEQLARYKTVYAESVSLKNKLASLMKDENEKEYKTEKCRTAIREIAEARLKKGEEEELENRRKIVKNAQKLAKQARIVYRALYKNEKGGSACDLMEIAQTALEQLSEVLPESEKRIAALEGFRAELEEIALSAAAISEVAGENPTEELNRIEDRLDLIKALKKKYGQSVEEIFAFQKQSEAQLNELQGREGEIRMLREQLEASVEKARAEASALSEKRKRAAKQLEDAVNGQMRFLDLDKVIFKVDLKEEYIAPDTPKLSSNGCNDLRFLITTNPGEPFKPLALIASGGELSRIMLAIKVALQDKESTPTLVFDEIDTGVSGRTSQKIGIKLREIGSYTQVFCVTHSAQVAACGHHHIKITKNEENGRSVTELRVLDQEERVEELARIMGGIHLTQSVKKSARELLEDGQNSE